MPVVREDAFTRRFVDVGYTLNSLPRGTRTYVIKSEGDLPVEVSKFIQKTAGRNDAIYIAKDEVPSLRFQQGDVILTMNKEMDQLDPLLKRFPNGELQELQRIWMYKIK